RHTRSTRDWSSDVCSSDLDSRRDELDRALALGPRRTEGRPLYAIAILGRDGDLELLPAGDAQPLYRDREVATSIAARLETKDPEIGRASGRERRGTRVVGV